MALGQEDKSDLDISLRNLVIGHEDTFEKGELHQQNLSEKSYKLRSASEMDLTTCHEFKMGGCPNCEENDIYSKSTFKDMLEELMR